MPAGDEAWDHLDVPTLQSAGITDLLVYCGPAMPPVDYIDGVLGAGITITFIDEGSTAPYAVADPYGDGVRRVQAAEAKLAGLYPADCRIMYVLSDQDVSTPGPGDPRVQAHAHGIDTATTRPGWLAYSNRNGVDAARSVCTRLTGSMVPATWGANGTDTLVQQIGSPVAGLDIDAIQAPEWGQWHPGGHDVASMYVTRQADPNGTGIWVTDGQTKRWVGPDEWGFVNFVSGANPPKVVPISDQWWNSLPTAGTPIDTAALAKAIAAALPPITGGLAPADVEKACETAVLAVMHRAA